MTTATAEDDRSAIRVDRTVAELRQGRPIKLCQDDHHQDADALLCCALETLPHSERLHLIGAGATLTLTGERCTALGLQGEAQTLVLPATDALSQALRLALQIYPDPAAAASAQTLRRFDAGDLARAGLSLVKHARLMPALLALPWRPQFRERYEPLAVSAAEIARYPRARARALSRVSDAPVPLEDAADSRFIVFRSADGATEHVAVVIGEPDTSRPVLTRLHSACLTGDLFASLRCDCGEQLRGAVAALSAAGGGLLLYLAQEGRNTGLANKLRAYRLQQQGLDTICADAQLGFRDDERDYEIAAALLRELGVSRLRLLTNNPRKIDALTEAGIEVCERLPLRGSVNPHNRNYLQTKKQAGHLL